MTQQSSTIQQQTQIEEQEPHYLMVFIILAIFTIFEIGTAYLPSLPMSVKLGLLVFLAATKVGMVLLYFMHLKFDNRFFAFPISLGGVLVVPLLLIVTLTAPPATSRQTTGGAANDNAPQAAASGETTVNVTEKTYQISLSTNSVQPGQVTFNVENQASDQQHELLIIKTDKSADALPLDDKGNLAEDQLNIVDTAENISPGGSKTITDNLVAGHYILACNLPGHFQQGMHVPLTVGNPGKSSSSESSNNNAQTSSNGSSSETNNNGQVSSQVTSNGNGTALNLDLSTDSVNMQLELTVGNPNQNTQSSKPDNNNGSSAASTSNSNTQSSSSASSESNNNAQTSSSGTTVNVTETGYNIDLSTDSLQPGQVTFNVSNNASDQQHEVLIIKTDKSADALPLDDKGDLVEDQLNIVAAAEDIPAGKSKTITVNLEPGNYVLACNKPGHFQQGMYAEFTVKPVVATVDVEETSYVISPSTDTVPAGNVQFRVSNDANDQQHEMLIIKTDKSPDKLALDDKGNLPEDQLNIVAAAEDIPAGETKTIMVNLEAGHYILVCNKPGHFQQGMYAEFTVQEEAQVTDIDVSMTTYGYNFSSNSAPAGLITFHLSNDATDQGHHFVVVNTDTAPDALPTKDDGNVDESAIDIIAKRTDVKPGASADLTVNLDPGHYVIFCNRPGHFQQGMYAEFTVEGQG